jgi:hypothetical protein
VYGGGTFSSLSPFFPSQLKEIAIFREYLTNIVRDCHFREYLTNIVDGCCIHLALVPVIKKLS